MSPRRRSLLSIVVIALALGVTVLARRLEPPPPPPPGADLQPVFDISASAVRGIDLETWQGKLRATRVDGAWRVDEVRLGHGSSVAEPGAPVPDAAEIDETLTTLVSEVVATPQIDRFAPEALPMRDFGLDPPQATITVELDSGERQTLQIGALTITTSALYARVLPSPDVFQIGSLIFNNVAAALFRLRTLDVASGTQGPS